jgi:hypothetical protein
MMEKFVVCESMQMIAPGTMARDGDVSGSENQIYFMDLHFFSFMTERGTVD